MSEPTDGGPAFPVTAMNDPSHPASKPGMTLRDYLAGQAVVGLLSGRPGAIVPTEWAAVSYLIADAMLAAREGTP